MKAYNKHLFLLIRRILLAMLLFFFGRLFFLLLNYTQYSNDPFGELVRIFFLGMRFDLSAVIYFNLPIILMHIFPIGKLKSHRTYQGFIKYYFLIVNSLLLLVNLSDARYFGFSFKRSTAYMLDMIANTTELPSLLPFFALEYWYVAVTWILLTVFAWFVYGRTRLNPEGRDLPARYKFVDRLYPFIAFIVLLFLLGTGARGGI